MRIVRDEVIKTALRLLDEVGMDGLTMRRLANALNIQAPSLYWHFVSKDTLLAGMADALLQSVAKNNPEDELWDTRLRRVACEVRIALLARRDAARVFAGTYPLSENVLRVGSLLIGCLKQGGADDRTASWGAFTLVYFVIGFVIEEQAMGGDRMLSVEAEAQVNALFPLAVVAMREITASSSDERFNFGLDLQIQGLKAVLSGATAGYQAIPECTVMTDVKSRNIDK